jgi:hypothetical protein
LVFQHLLLVRNSYCAILPDSICRICSCQSAFYSWINLYHKHENVVEFLYCSFGAWELKVKR